MHLHSTLIPTFFGCILFDHRFIWQGFRSIFCRENRMIIESFHVVWLFKVCFFFIIDGLEKYVSASRHVVGNVVYMFSIVVKFGKNSVELISRMTCKISGHFKFSCASTNLKYCLNWRRSLTSLSSMSVFHVKSARNLNLFLSCSFD